MARPLILTIDDDVDILEILKQFVEMAGADVVQARSADEAEALFETHKFDIVFSDVHMRGRSGLALLEGLKDKHRDVPPFVFVTGNVDPRIVEAASKLGAADVLLKPFTSADVQTVIRRAGARRSDVIQDIMQMVQSISGVVLGPEKRFLVETRLNRRARQLGFVELEEYFHHFKANRHSEVKEVVSLVTTHTTEFFRESRHFDMLIEKLFPQVVSRGPGGVVRIWSAACSTGEEVYSLAICYLEFLRTRGIAPAAAPRLEILATDIDFNSVDRGSKGIYPSRAIDQVDRSIVSSYFDRGTGELDGLVRVRDQVHKCCRFQQFNLLDYRQYPKGPFDVIFLRNVLIYFAKDDVAKIGRAMADSLSREGLLVLGHSESMAGMDVPLELISSSVYRHPSAQSRPSVQAVAAPIRVLIVDDSSTIRLLMRKVLASQYGFEVVGEAENPKEAEPLLARLRPDVMALDIHMPEMDGITWLRSLADKRPPPVVMVSSVGIDDAMGAMSCFEAGAFDYIEKPSAASLDGVADKIREVMRAAAQAGRSRPGGRHVAGSAKIKAPAAPGGSAGVPKGLPRECVIAIGASTGGIEALTDLLQELPESAPPVLVVQHIPPTFSAAFASRLGPRCRVRVKEAEHGDLVAWGTVYIAPGGRQMGVRRLDSGLQIVISDDAPVNRHRPSVDFLFQTLATEAADRYTISSAILTGMGADGARGLLALKGAGAHTIAQDEQTSTVYGMPKAAADLGAALEVLPLPSIAYHLLKGLVRKRAA